MRGLTPKAKRGFAADNIGNKKREDETRLRIRFGRREKAQMSKVR